MYEVKVFSYGVEGVHEYKEWLKRKRLTIEIVAVNNTKQGLLYVTYKKIRSQ